ncbi:MAG: DinB family protein [Armatimonadota bacterium]|nr:DinB family protein [Armatimonadota bacterium]
MRDLLLYGLQATHTRLQRCLEDLSEDEARTSPAGGLSPLIWQAGHVATTDFAFARRAGGQTPVPPGYETLFQMGTGGQADYPPLAAVRRNVDRAQQILEALTKTATLDAPADGRSYRTVGEMLVFAAYHRGYHIGKMTTLRALLKKPRLFG